MHSFSNSFRSVAAGTDDAHTSPTVLLRDSDFSLQCNITRFFYPSVETIYRDRSFKGSVTGSVNSKVERIDA